MGSHWTIHFPRFVAAPATVVGCLLAVLLPAAASAQVRVETRADGTTVIVNETPTQRSRRLAVRLQAVPAESGLDLVIERHARLQDLNPRLVQAVIQVESGYNPRALSRRGAQGLMQLMPGTAKLLGVEDPYDPEENVRGGTEYLRRQLDRFSNLSLALAAYNAGPSAVAQHGGIPPYAETRDYVRKVLGLLGHSVPPGEAPQLLREYARDQARERQRIAERRAAEERKKRGGRVYLHRDENNRIVVTSAPPKSN